VTHDPEFKSDGCSFFPDEINGISLLPPCVEHDYAYWKGGTRAQRLRADKRLYDRICDLGMPVVACAMYRAVRCFGGRFWPRRKHWGYKFSKEEYGYATSKKRSYSPRKRKS